MQPGCTGHGQNTECNCNGGFPKAQCGELDGTQRIEDTQCDSDEAKRDDENYSYAAVWEFMGEGKKPALHKEDLVFENVELTQRSYK